MRLDILGASAATLSMIFELLENLENKENFSLRIIKNTEHSLDAPFKTQNLTYEILETEEVETLAERLFLGVYKSKTKSLVYDFFSAKYKIDIQSFINLLHPQTAIANTVKLGRGIQINPMTTIAPYAEIGNFVSINRNASIGHHTKVEDFSTINPGVHIAGHCHVGESVTIGMGALVVDAKKIGRNSIIGAGALVTKDVPENVLVMGSPAKIIREL